MAGGKARDVIQDDGPVRSAVADPGFPRRIRVVRVGDDVHLQCALPGVVVRSFEYPPFFPEVMTLDGRKVPGGGDERSALPPNRAVLVRYFAVHPYRELHRAFGVMPRNGIGVALRSVGEPTMV